MAKFIRHGWWIAVHSGVAMGLRLGESAVARDPVLALSMPADDCVLRGRGSGRMKSCLKHCRVAAAMASRVLMLAAVATLGLVASARTQEFYAGKTINLVVGYSVGGGYDQYARLLARHLGRHIPGQPTIVVQNMPGAATLTAIRHLSANAPRDGTAITMFDPGLILESVSQPERYQLKLTDYQWIGGMSREVTICYAWHATGIKTLKDMLGRKEFLIGLTAKGSAVYANGRALQKLFNAPIRQIAGYPGSNEQRLAIERGELDGACASWSAIPQDWIGNRRINPLVRFAMTQPADMPPTPYVNDLARDDDQRALLNILNAPGELGRPFIMAREVPAERVRTVIAAFERALQDDALLAEARKQSLPIDLFSAAESEQIVRAIYAASPELIRRLKDVVD
jgi:tripartite-type tricarboxylate transporter receptor subunit TctC